LQLHVLLVLQPPVGLLDQREGDGQTGTTAISSPPILARACR
jgi:hypothetical protein